MDLGEVLADPGGLLGLLQPDDSIPASKSNKSLRNAPGREGRSGGVGRQKEGLG